MRHGPGRHRVEARRLALRLRPNARVAQNFFLPLLVSTSMKRPKKPDESVLAGFLFLAAGSSAMAACTDVRPLVCPLPLSVHYNPATNVNATTRLYTPPPVDKCTSADALGDVVQNAFRLAQGKLQDEICALAKIFIVSD